VRGFQKVGKDEGVEILARQSNKHGVEKAINGAGVPKGPDIKLKTLKEGDDALIKGVTSEHYGEMTHKLPTAKPGMNPDQITRYNQLKQQYWDRYGDVKDLINKGKIYEGEGGYLIDAVTNKPIVSDVDLFDIVKLDGGAVDEATREAVITALKKQGLVTHPDVMSWQPKTLKDWDIFNDIVSKVKPGGKEHLIKFGPSGTPEAVHYITGGG
jgi:hypothetical protein